MAAETTTTPAPVSRRPRRLRRWLASGVLVLLLVVAAAVGFAVWRLSTGPVELEAVRSRIAAALAEAVGPTGISALGGAEVAWTLQSGPTLRLGGLEATSPGGGFSAQAPNVEVGVDVGSALSGAPRPRTVRVTDPRLTLALPPPSNEVKPVPAFDRLLADLEREFRKLDAAVRDGLQTVEITGASVEFSRPFGGYEQRWSLTDINGTAELGEGGVLDARLSGRGAEGRWQLRARRSVATDGGVTLILDGSNLSLVDFGGVHMPGIVVEPMLAFAVEARFRADGTAESAELTIGLGPGDIRFGLLKTDRVRIDEAEVKLAWRPATANFVVERGTVRAGDSRFDFTGSITPPPDVRSVWLATLTPTEVRLLPAGTSGQPVVIRDGVADVQFDPRTFTLDLTRGSFSWPSAELKTRVGVEVVARVDFSKLDPSMLLSVRGSALGAHDVARIWPVWVAPDARKWMLENVRAGRILEGGRIDLALPRLDRPETWGEDAVRIEFQFADLLTRTFGEMPLASDAAGQVKIDKRRLVATATRGQAKTASGRLVKLADFSFAIPNIFNPKPEATTRVRMIGDTVALAELADAEPIRGIKRAGMTPDQFEGTGNAVATVDFPLAEVVPVEKVRFRVDAQVEGFGSKKPIEGRRFDQGKMALTVDPSGMKAVGKARIDGVVADLDLFVAFAGGDEKRDLKLTLDDAARKRLGLDLAPFLTGPIPVSLSRPQGDDGPTRIEADLTQARIAIPVIGWTKGPGVSAKLALDYREQTDGGSRLDAVQLEAEGGLDVRGSLQLDAQRQPVQGQFDRFSVRTGDQAKLRFSRQGKSVSVALDAAVFDARGLVREMKRTDEQRPDPHDTVVKIRAGRLIGFDDVVLNDVILDGEMRRDVMTKLDLAGRVGASGSISARLQPDGAVRQLTLRTDDLGGLMRFLEIEKRVKGGAAQLEATFTAPGVATGRMYAERFEVTGVEVVVTAEGRSVERATRIDFDRGAARFGLAAGRLEIQQAMLRGETQGAVAEGIVDLDNRRLNIAGTYIPAFGLNNLMGRIPVVGEIMGGRNEGLLGVTFAIVGSFTDARLKVNPLSAIAPGIFRRIFEFRDHRSGQAATVPPAN